jgi:hypothetical protein
LINLYNNTITSTAKREREIYTHMHPDDLKAIWICRECKTVFVFHSDVDDHKGLSGHKMIEKMMMMISTTLA